MRDIQAIIQPTVPVLIIPHMRSLFPFVNHPEILNQKKRKKKKKN